MNRCTYTKEQLIMAVKESFSISETCRRVGLKPIGGNHNTLKNKFKEFDIDISHFTGQG